MISNWAGGGATTTLGAAQLAYGLYQQKKNKRPEYTIPPEIQANLNQGEQAALQGMPEEQKQQYINNLQRSQAFSLSQMGSRKAGLAGVAAINQQGADAYGNLLSMDTQAKMANQDKLYGLRQNMADYKDQAFQINKSNPYYEKTAQNNALIGAGMQNVSQGFQAGNSGGDFSGMTKQPQQSQSMGDYRTAPNQPQQFDMSPYQQQTIYSQPPSQQGDQLSLSGMSGGGYGSYWK